MLLYEGEAAQSKGEPLMPEARACPECQTVLPDDAPQELCPKCLLQQALSGSDQNSPAGSGLHTAVFQGRFRPPAPAELAEHFPDFEILELLGQGGMGAVYKARQKKLDRLVALKIMPLEVAGDPAFAERFAREARALARLNHPNIVAVHDYGEKDGLYYFIMEYVDGLNLRQLMQGGPVAPHIALQIVPQICDALQYAHEGELVHRDIKPENILVDRRGRVKIADFGLAKLVGSAPAVLTLTGSHQIMGTPHYMAPEQMERPSSVDHRADIYSLGVVFYEMLTGELPLGRFGSPSGKAGVDQRLDEIVLRALEKEPARRYQAVSEIKADVESLAKRTNAPVSPLPGLDRELIRTKVLAPAAGLLFSGFVALVSWAVVGIIFAGVAQSKLQYETQHAPALSWRALSVMLASVAALAIAAASGLVIAGAIKMMRLQSYAFAVTASIWAMLPWSYGFLIGLPFGIWALRVLRYP